VKASFLPGSRVRATEGRAVSLESRDAHLVRYDGEGFYVVAVPAASGGNRELLVHEDDVELVPGGLTDAQREIRAYGVGASEIGAVLDVSPHSSTLDVWLSKTGRASVDHGEQPLDRRWAGTNMEDALSQLYRRARYGDRTEMRTYSPKKTYLHQTCFRMLASPDVLVRRDSSNDLEIEGGAELKLVGADMRELWADRDWVPLHVELQARQCMAVLGVEWWDVFALVGGTDVRLVRIERDRDVESTLVEACETFWEFVTSDTPPPSRSPRDVRRALLATFPGSDGKAVVPRPEPEVVEMMQWLATARAMRKHIEPMEEQLTNELCALVGDAYGIENDFARFIWFRKDGQVNWHAVARELAGGEEPPPALVEKYRGRSTRSPLLTVHSETKKAKQIKAASKRQKQLTKGSDET
jgi:predicted phage-related endonuclease